MKELIDVLATTQMKIVVILLAIDVVLGIIGALVRKDFAFRKLGNFTKGPVLGYIFGLGVLGLVGAAIPRLAIIVLVAAVLVVIALLGSIVRNLGRIGVPLPGFLKK